MLPLNSRMPLKIVQRTHAVDGVIRELIRDFMGKLVNFWSQYGSGTKIFTLKKHPLPLWHMSYVLNTR